MNMCSCSVGSRVKRKIIGVKGSNSKRLISMLSSAQKLYVGA